MNKAYIKTKKYVYIAALVLIVLFSVGYSALSASLGIGGSSKYFLKAPVRITGISLAGAINGGYEVFSPEYTSNTTTIGAYLPNLTSAVTYEVTFTNYSDINYIVNNPSLYISSGMQDSVDFVNGQIVPAHGTLVAHVIAHYDGINPSVPADPTLIDTIEWSFSPSMAIFDTGKVVNAKMKKFVNSGSTYETTDTTITAILRSDVLPPEVNNMVNNMVSSPSSSFVIYMWYDSSNTTIYWYTEADEVYYNQDSSYFYSNLLRLENIKNDGISSSLTTNMDSMFEMTGSYARATNIKLDEEFDTSNVTSMVSMFKDAGFMSMYFSIDLGPNFDTSSVTDMTSMFSGTGTYTYELDLGQKFDTSNVMDMTEMFYQNPATTIYATDDFVTTSTNGHGQGMFLGCTHLVGGAGTVYDANHAEEDYAHIDGGVSNPGYFTLKKEAMFKTGKEVNARMKQFINSSATYNTSDTTITRVLRFTGTPNSSNLIEANKVSVSDSQYPIYMWYDSSTTTIYWYTEANQVYLNPDSSYFFRSLRQLNSLAMDDYRTTRVTDMSYMFAAAGMDNTGFTLRLGNTFDTSNVTNMDSMFRWAGEDSTVFTLSLNGFFDTSKVTNMNAMFTYMGEKSTAFTLYLGEKFDTSNVTDMNSMFIQVGGRNTSFTLDLGDKFDTSKVVDMESMFYQAGYSSTVFTIDLGDKFDTSSVTNMELMFYEAGPNSTVFTIDLGDKFDTSNVTNMWQMFAYAGPVSTEFTELDLGAQFNTAKVTNMFEMFRGIPVTTIYAPTTFVTTLVNGSTYMFQDCTNLVGGAGTLYSSSHLDKDYAHIDGGPSNPGYFTGRGTAIFDTGQNVNAKIKQFVTSTATYTTSDTTITNIKRYTGTPSSSYLVDSNKVSASTSPNPIYMWYDSNTTTIYWYSSAPRVYYGPNASYFYYNLRALKELSNDHIDSSNITNMSRMFMYAGHSDTGFGLTLDKKFNTSNVENMSYMFGYIAYNSTNDNPLVLGPNFDTSNVTNMSYMFQYLGYNDSNFTVLDLGDKFDTSSVTNMNYMFRASRKIVTIYAPTTFVTTAVTSSSGMFSNCSSLVGGAGTTYESSIFTVEYAHIDEGPSNPGYFTLKKVTMFKTGKEVNAIIKQLFTSDATYSTTDTSLHQFGRLTNPYGNFDPTEYTNVATSDSAYPIYIVPEKNGMVLWYTEANVVYLNPDSSYLFYSFRGLNSLSEINNFNTSKVTDMSNMFAYIGFSSTSFTLDLGDKFDTKNVTNMNSMFNATGYTNTNFTLSLGNKFDTSKVTNMRNMFYNTGYSSTLFTLNLGSKFDTGKVTNMYQMFTNSGYSNTSYTLDLGSNFDTSKVTTMYSMFYYAGYNSTSFTLNLGNKFDTSSCDNMGNMFYYTGRNSTSFSLSLGDNFDTSSVTNFSNMFYGVGYSNTAFTTLDLGLKFSFSSATSTVSMFHRCRYIETIAVPSGLTLESSVNSTNMFYGCLALEGSSGTVYNASNVDGTYAHVDGGTSNPGYFTAIATRLLSLDSNISLNNDYNYSFSILNSGNYGLPDFPITARDNSFVTISVTDSDNNILGVSEIVLKNPYTNATTTISNQSFSLSASYIIMSITVEELSGPVVISDISNIHGLGTLRTCTSTEEIIGRNGFNSATPLYCYEVELNHTYTISDANAGYCVASFLNEVYNENSGAWDTGLVVPDDSITITSKYHRVTDVQFSNKICV